MNLGLRIGYMCLLRVLPDWFIGLPVSFVTGQSDLLKLCFYYTHLQTVLKTCNNGVLQTKKRFWKKKKDLFLSNNVHQRRKPQQQQQPRPSMDNSHVNVKSLRWGVPNVGVIQPISVSSFTRCIFNCVSFFLFC